MSLWLLVGACLLVPPVWAVSVAYAIRRRERRRVLAQRQAAPPSDYQI
jgi:hypothetical protein